VDQSKRVYEERELLDQTGQESDLKAAKVVSQVFKAEQISQSARRTFFLEKLDARRKFNDYNKLCAQITLFFLKEQDLPRSIEYKVQYDTKGVLLFVTIGRRIYPRAFRSVREPIYDLNACEVFAMAVGDLDGRNN